MNAPWCGRMRSVLACTLLLSVVRTTRAASECAADGGLCAADASLTLDPANAPPALLEAAREAQLFVSGLYHALHRIPELKYEEHRTSELIAAELTKLGVSFDTGLAGGTGIVATIGKGSPVVALRADMDALPMQEPHELLPAGRESNHGGLMHACGHDGHMAMLLGAARLLKAREAQLRGTALLVFQPAEEGGAGAQRMLQDSGLLRSASAVFGLHVAPWLPLGTVSSRAGTIMAASTTFVATLRGRGGHAAFPHQLVDPVVAGAACVAALQTLASREADPATEGVVVSVTRFLTPADSTALNVMPDEVELGGTIRAFTVEAFDRMQRRVYEIIAAQAAIHGCNATVHSAGRIPYPPVVNDAALVTRGLQLAAQFAVAETQAAPIMGAEDFAFYAQRTPAAFFFVGQGGGNGTHAGLHSRRFRLHEDVLPVGVALHTALALHLLT